MTSGTLLRRSLRFHARAHLGVVLGAAIGSAALIGALVVGDSVRSTLIDRALKRLGPFRFAISTQERLFLDTSPQGGHRSLLFGEGSSILEIPGVASKPDGSARANGVNVLGVESWGKVLVDHGALPESTKPPWPDWDAGNTVVFINQALARRLAVQPGDEILVRIQKPNALGLDAAISPRDQSAAAMRVKIAGIVSADALGDFSLSAQALPPANLFLPLRILQAMAATGDQVNIQACGGVSVAPKLGWWGIQRSRASVWLKRHSAAGLANLIAPETVVPLPDVEAVPFLTDRLRGNFSPRDVGLSIHAVQLPAPATLGGAVPPFVELTTSRIFLEKPVIEAARRIAKNAPSGPVPYLTDTLTNNIRILTYLANLISAGTNATPYSMVTAADAPVVPADMRDDEILVNQWLADDLNVKPGDSVQLSYFTPDSGSRLIERTNSFRVREIVPQKGIYADRTLMPEFPGVAKAESTHDWDAGFPLVYRIRDKDEAYWKRYRGTPKAFITLAAGQAMWANRFGWLTAIRYPLPTSAIPDYLRAIGANTRGTNTTADVNSYQDTEGHHYALGAYRDAVSENLRANLDPADVGLRIEPVREQALKAATQSQDFGQLFLGFSFFLVVAALLLMALLFQFGLEQRAAEIGTFLALGFSAKQVRRMLLAEGTALALIGGALGVLGGLLYARAMLHGLATVWRSAVGGALLEFHVTSASLVLGTFASVGVAVLTIWLTLRRQARQPIVNLLSGGEDRAEVNSPRSTVHSPQSKVRSLWSVVSSLWSLVCLTGGVAIIGWAVAKGETSNAEAFFCAGTLLLIAGLAGASSFLRRLACSPCFTQYAIRNTQHVRHPTADRPSLSRLSALSLRSSARRRNRSLATIALLACGCFVIVAVGVFRLDANADANRRTSGTGGFALIGQSTMPVVQDLNTGAGREAAGLSAQDLEGVSVVPFRVRAGDEASCLNLNRAQKPRLLGVSPELLAGRFTFAKAAPGFDLSAGWDLLTNHVSRFTFHDEIPAIADANSIEWSLGKSIGDTVDYTDENGRTFKVRLVGALANSILQGNLIIDEAEFVKRFPNESGYRMFLLDAPSNRVQQVSATLTRALQDYGLELSSAADRLQAFNAVQNTYLGTFQVLGGLGLLLGSAGLGVVVLRNVLERRGELAVLLALGFRRREVRGLVLSEHGFLLVLGLGLGVGAAAVAVLPALLRPGMRLPYGSLGVTVAAVLLNGFVWTWLAARVALRGELLAALRNE